MKFEVNINKKIFIFAIIILIIGFAGFYVNASINPSQPWHFLQQIAISNDSEVSVDDNSNSIVDKAEQLCEGDPLVCYTPSDLLASEGEGGTCVNFDNPIKDSLPLCVNGATGDPSYNQPQGETTTQKWCEEKGYDFGQVRTYETSSTGVNCAYFEEDSWNNGNCHNKATSIICCNIGGEEGECSLNYADSTIVSLPGGSSSWENCPTGYVMTGVYKVQNSDGDDTIKYLNCTRLCS